MKCKQIRSGFELEWRILFSTTMAVKLSPPIKGQLSLKVIVPVRSPNVSINEHVQYLKG